MRLSFSVHLVVFFFQNHSTMAFFKTILISPWILGGFKIEVIFLSNWHSILKPPIILFFLEPSFSVFGYFFSNHSHAKKRLASLLLCLFLVKKRQESSFFWDSCRYSKFHISGYTQCSGRRLISRRMFFARTRRHKAWIIILCSLLRNKGPTHGQSRISKAVLNEWIYLDKCVHPGTNTIDSICLFKPSKENIPGIPSFLVQ